MLIRFTGPVQRRILGHWDWNAANHYEQEVEDASTIAHLLVMEQGFEIAPDEPLLALLGLLHGKVGELALEGIASAADLASLEDKEVMALELKLGLFPGLLQDRMRVVRGIGMAMPRSTAPGHLSKE